MTPVPRRAVAAALAAALSAAGVAGGVEAPPQDIRVVSPSARIVLQLARPEGPWTLWSGPVQGYPWLFVAGLRETAIAGSQCPGARGALSVCMHGSVAKVWDVVTGRVRTRVATLEARDPRGARLPLARRRGAYLVVTPLEDETIVVLTARDRHGTVIARRRVRN